MDEPRDHEELGEGSVLSPEELDFTEEEEVEELNESRFVIGAEGQPQVENKAEYEAREAEAENANTNVVSAEEGDTASQTNDRDRPAEAEQRQSEPAARSRSEGEPLELTGTDVKRWITANLERTDSQYAYRLAAKTGDDVSHQELASDDIGMAFDGLLMWYAQQVGDGTAVEDTLGILLAESNIRVRFPLIGMISYLEKHDLSPEDSIGDLLSVIREHDGLVFPRGRQR